ncbi:MAG: hypothetical protein LBO66_00860 [Deltaproteobacteria bacterium]|jgi:hypothetical protein|nr:hypothetical protein [Deltaproteobacteria bacterium]
MSESHMVRRDTGEMLRFSERVHNYCDEMKYVCRNLKMYLEESSSLMKDQTSQKAFAKVEALAEDLAKGLPIAMEAAEKVKASALTLERIADISRDF